MFETLRGYQFTNKYDFRSYISLTLLVYTTLIYLGTMYLHFTYTNLPNKRNALIRLLIVYLHAHNLC